MREAIPRPRHGHSHEQAALVVRNGPRKREAPENGALRHGNRNLAVHRKLRVVHRVRIGREREHRVRVYDVLARSVGAPSHELIAQARHGIERHLAARLVHARALHTATAIAVLALHHHVGAHRHLVRVGEQRLQLKHVAVKGADQLVVKRKPAVGVACERRCGAVFVHKLPARKAPIVGLLRVQLYHLAKLVRAAAR